MDKLFAKRCGRRATTVHHIRERGVYYLAEEWWLGSCVRHHDWIDTHRREAERLGYFQRTFQLDIRRADAESSSTMPKMPKVTGAKRGVTNKRGGVSPKSTPIRPSRPSKMMKGVGPVLR